MFCAYTRPRYQVSVSSGFIIIIVIPPQTVFVGGYTVFTLSDLLSGLTKRHLLSILGIVSTASPKPTKPLSFLDL